MGDASFAATSGTSASFVEYPGKPVVTTASLNSANEGDPFSQTLAASGGYTAYSWGATGLPSSLSINSSTGEISGTPDGGAAGSSPYSVSVTLTDAQGQTHVKAYSMTVTAS